MALPFYNPQAAGGSLFDSLRSAAKRELNKVQAKFWGATSSVLDSVDRNVAQPALKARNAVVEPIADAGKSILGGLKIGTVLVVLAVAFLGFLYIRPFLPGRK